MEDILQKCKHYFQIDSSFYHSFVTWWNEQLETHHHVNNNIDSLPKMHTVWRKQQKHIWRLCTASFTQVSHEDKTNSAFIRM